MPDADADRLAWLCRDTQEILSELQSDDFPRREAAFEGDNHQEIGFRGWFGYAVDLGGEPEGGEDGDGDGGGAIAAYGLGLIPFHPIFPIDLHTQEAVPLLFKHSGRFESGFDEAFLSPQVVFQRS